MDGIGEKYKFGSEFLNEDFEILGTGEDGMYGTLKEFSEHTVYREVDPNRFVIFSLVRCRRHLDEPFAAIRISPDDADARILIPSSMEQVFFSKKNKNFGTVSTDAMRRMGMTESQLEDIEKAGFFLQYPLTEKRTMTLIPSKAFLATLCQRLGIGKLNAGIDVLRNAYLASMMRDAEPFVLVYRDNGRYGKAFGCFSLKFEKKPQTVIFDFMKCLQEKGEVSVREWRLNHFITNVNFAFHDYILPAIGESEESKAKITPGVRLSLSDIGDSSYVLQNALYADGGAAFLSETVKHSHKGTLNVEDMVSRYYNEEYPKLFRVMEQLDGLGDMKVKSQKKVIQKIMNKTGFRSNFGAVGARRFKESYLTESKDVCGTMLEVAVFMLKIPGLIRNAYPVSTVERVSQGIGKMFELNLEAIANETY